MKKFTATLIIGAVALISSCGHNPTIIKEIVSPERRIADSLAFIQANQHRIADSLTLIQPNHQRKADSIAKQQGPPHEVFDDPVHEDPCYYPGGDTARIKFLQDNMKYPEEAIKRHINGKVFVTFVVEVDGSITNVKLLRGIGYGCDEEAIRIVKSMPKWVPGKQKGVPVRTQFNLPINFKLE